jgi:hypothetical protein
MYTVSCAAAGYTFLNSDNRRQKLDGESWHRVLTAFTERFPKLKQSPETQKEAMNFRLVDSGWDQILDEALSTGNSSVRIICPFIKEKAAMRLLQYGHPEQFEVITRFNLDCFRDGVSDIAALRLLFQAGAKIRGIKNLHAKAYLIGPDHAIVTSANLTEQGLLRNHEFGFYAQDETIVANCHEYFYGLWKKAGPDLVLASLDQWNRKVIAALASGAGTRTTPSLGDKGKDVGFPAEPVVASPLVASAEQGFVKFFGEGHNREVQSHQVLDEVKSSGAHWACTYPTTKKPRKVRDGAIMFMARIVKPSDILIFGRGIGLQYREGRDDATRADIKLRDWKAKWSRYIRVHDVKFVNGTLAEGVSMNELMEELGSDSFASTRRHALAGKGNTNPRSAFNQQAAVELTPMAIAWLDERLNQSFAENGEISPDVLATLDWPKVKL